MVISWKRLGEPDEDGVYRVAGLGSVIADPQLFGAVVRQGMDVDLEIAPVTLEAWDGAGERQWVVTDIIPAGGDTWVDFERGD